METENGRNWRKVKWNRFDEEMIGEIERLGEMGVMEINVEGRVGRLMRMVDRVVKKVVQKTKRMGMRNVR